MASNALSKRRGFKPRPDVCHTEKNPGRCHPPEPPLPPRTCALLPEVWVTNEGEGDAVDLEACCPELPEDVLLDVEVTALFGNVDTTEGSLKNCTDVLTIHYAAPEFPCIDVITAIVTWSDGGKCTTTSTVTVEEED